MCVCVPMCLPRVFELHTVHRLECVAFHVSLCMHVAAVVTVKVSSVGGCVSGLPAVAHG